MTNSIYEFLISQYMQIYNFTLMQTRKYFSATVALNIRATKTELSY